MKVNLCNVVLACGLLAAVPCRAAWVRGVVQFPDESTLRRGGFWRVPNGVLPIAPALHDVRASALVLLTPGGGTAGKVEREKAEKAEIRVQGLRLQPAVTVAPPQTALLLRNEDRRPLVLTLACPGAAAEARTIEGGGQATVTLPGAGACALRGPGLGHLMGMVVIDAGPGRSLAGRVEPDGSFRIEAPEGSYQARLFWQGITVGPQPVVVTAQGADLTLSVRGATGPQDIEGPRSERAADRDAR